MAGPKSDAATIEARRHRLTELLSGGSTVNEAFQDLAAEGFPASRMTLWRDIVELRKDWKTANVKNYDALREKQMGILLKIEQALLEDLVEPEKARVWLAIRKDVSSLLGLDAPSRSVSVSMSMNPEDMSHGQLLEQMMNNLTSEQREQVWNFVASLQGLTLPALPKPSSGFDWSGARSQEIVDRAPDSKALEGQILGKDGEALRYGR